MSVGSDEGNFSFPEECRRPFPSKRGRWYDGLLKNTPSASLPYGSSVAQSAVLPSLGTDWHLANPLKASLRPLI